MSSTEKSWLQWTVTFAGGTCSDMAEQEASCTLDKDLQCQNVVSSCAGPWSGTADAHTLPGQTLYWDLPNLTGGTTRDSGCTPEQGTGPSSGCKFGDYICGHALALQSGLHRAS